LENFHRDVSAALAVSATANATAAQTKEVKIIELRVSQERE
jgi:hypothetical protein